MIGLPGAVAADGADITTTLDLKDLPTTTVSTNDTVYVEKFTVSFTVRDVVCAQAATFEATLAATGTVGSPQDPAPEDPAAPANSTVAFEFTPAKAAFLLSAGQYVVTPYSQTVEATMLVRPSSIPHDGLDVAVKVSATVPPGNNGCQGQGTVGATKEAPEYTVHFGRGTEPAPLTPTPEMPSVGFVLGSLAALGGLVLRRRSA